MSEDTRAAMQLEGQRVKTGAEGASKAVDHLHEAWQNEADRQHERDQNAQDRSAQQAQHSDKMGMEGQKLMAPLLAPDPEGSE